MTQNGVVLDITSEDLSDLPAGTYSVDLVDENGCSVFIEVEITEPEALEITETHSDYTGYGVSCNGASDGSIDVTVTGGTGVYTYAWSNGATSEDLSDIGAGIYSVTATDENGCSIFIEGIEITEADVIQIDLDNITPGPYSENDVNLEFGYGSVSITVWGCNPLENYTYIWSNGETSEDISGLIAGTYSVDVTDSNGCMVFQTVVITEPPTLNITASTVTHVSCYGDCDGSASVSVLGGTPPYNYSWSNGQTTSSITNLCGQTSNIDLF